MKSTIILMTERNDRVYNDLGVISMNATEKAIELVESLPAEKLDTAVAMLKLLANTDDTRSLVDLITFELSCEREDEDISPEEMADIIQGEAEIKAGRGVKAEDVWEKL